MTASPYPQAAGPPAAPSRTRARLFAVAAAVVLLTAALSGRTTANAAVPPTQPGWTLMFSDDFNGAAGSGVSGNWRLTTGTSYPGGPAQFGTGEVETMTADRSNVALDGSGNLRITPQRGGPTGWTSARIGPNRDDFQPPARGKAP